MTYSILFVVVLVRLLVEPLLKWLPTLLLDGHDEPPTGGKTNARRSWRAVFGDPGNRRGLSEQAVELQQDQHEQQHLHPEQSRAGARSVLYHCHDQLF